MMIASGTAHILEIDGSRAHVADHGEGIPLICLHTAGQSGIQWRDVVPDLVALGYRVIVPDLPGHGHSDEPVEGPIDDLETYADWTLRMADALELDRPYVVGCSIGGKIALSMAARDSSRLSGIVTMAACAVDDVQDERSLRRSLIDAISPSRTDRTYLGTLAALGSSVAESRRRRIAARHRREDPQVALRDLIGWARHDVTEDLARIACPATVIAGEDDLWVDPADAERTAAAIPGATFASLPGIGHYPMEELPDIADRLHEWIAAMEAASRSPHLPDTHPLAVEVR